MDLTDPTVCYEAYNDLDDQSIQDLMAMLQGIMFARSRASGIIAMARSTGLLPEEGKAPPPASTPNPSGIGGKRSRETDDSNHSSFFREVLGSGSEADSEAEFEQSAADRRKDKKAARISAANFHKEASPEPAIPNSRKKGRKSRKGGRRAPGQGSDPSPEPNREADSGAGGDGAVGGEASDGAPPDVRAADGELSKPASSSYAAAAGKEGQAPKQKAGQPCRDATPALIVEGLNRDQAANPAFINGLLKDLAGLYYKTLCTKAGNRLLFPRCKGDSEQLQKAALPEGIRIREVKPSSKVDNSVLMIGVHHEIEDAYLSDKIGLKCRRIKSANRGGIATWKVRVFCGSAERKKEALSKGHFLIDKQRYYVREYKQSPAVLQCHKCSKFGHIASVCKQEQQTCKRCGGGHEAGACEAEKPKCSNCGGEHEASDFSCPKRVSAANDREAVKLAHRHSVQKGGEQLDVLRLACTVATVVSKVLEGGEGGTASFSTICNICASACAKYFRTDIKVEHLLYLINK